MIRRLRQWWCSRQHDKAYRFHSWRLLLDGKGSIRCRRCGVVREGLGFGDDDDTIAAEALRKYRTEGIIQ